MIHYLLHNEIDKSKWDHCIEQARYSIIYCYSWYLDVISPNWDALVEDGYDAVFPITWKKKYGVYYITQPVYAQQLGVFSRKDLNSEEMKRFLEHIPKKFIHFNITLNPSNLININSSYCLQPRKTYHVQLKDSYEHIFKKFSYDTQKNIKKSLARKLELKEIDISSVIDLYMQNVWYKTPLLTTNDYEILSCLCKKVILHKKCIVIGAFENGILSAGTIFFFSDNKIIFIFGSSNKIGRKNGAMRFIFDWIIKTNCNKDLVLDFEGSSISTVEYLYKNFGSDKVVFSNITHYKSKALNLLVDFKQKIKKSIAKHNINKYNKCQTTHLF